MSSPATSDSPLLGVALTGDHEGLAELTGALESPANGIGVLARITDVREAGAAIAIADPRAVLHCMSWTAGEAAEASARETLDEDVAAIRRQTPAPIILLVTGGEPEVVEAALAAGVDDVVLLPQRIETIAFAVHKACQALEREGAGAAADPSGRVITVFSPKGGTGKTVLSTNIAAYLATRTRKRVLLIDLDLQFGDAAIMLGLDPERTMFDLVEAPGDLDPGKLAGYTTRHRSGLDVLVAPMLPEQSELVTESKVLRLVEVAREAYDLVVIDTSPFFYGPMLALLGPTDQLFLLCGLDVPTLKNVRLSLRTLGLLGFPPERVNLVLNRVNPDIGLTSHDVEQALGIHVAFEVPNDGAVAQAVNRGSVPSLSDEESEFSRSVARIAASIVPGLVVPEAPLPATGGVTATRLRRLVPRRVVEGRA